MPGGTERMPPFVDPTVFDPLVDGVRLGKYHLVLGAGASHGCHNPQGELPMAEDLAAMLLDLIGVEQPGVSLPRAYDAAVDAVGKVEVIRFLRERYANADPQPWHAHIPRLAWEAVWTFNIDDVVERSYQEAEGRRQLPVVRTPREVRLPYGGAYEEVPLVHLHGYVGAIDSRADPHLVFGWSEYLDSIRNADRPSWQGRFREDFMVVPTIIIGARMIEELDVLEAVRDGNQSAAISGFPSVIVRPNITPLERKEYVRCGLVAIDAPADEFMEYLAQAVAAEEPSEPGTAYVSRYTERTFLALTDQVEDFHRPTGHDFYGGHSPEWLDLLDDLDARPAWAKAFVQELGRPEDHADVPRLYLLQGAAFTGKSTSLLRVAADLAKNGWEPYLIVGRDRLDFNETLQFLETRPKAVLLVDNAAGDAGDLGMLLQRADDARRRVVFIATERSDGVGRVTHNVSARYLVGVSTPIFYEPNQRLWLDILDRRAVRARLGQLEATDERARQLHFVQHRSDLFSALASLEDAAGFIDRGLEVYRDLPPDARNAFAVVALVGLFDLPAPLTSVSATAGIRLQRLVEMIHPGGVLASWLVLDQFEPGVVRLRHRYLSNLLVSDHVREVHATPLIDLSRAICESLADQISPRTIRRKTLAHRIVAALMDLETVQSLCPARDVDNWYESLRPSFQGIARYWEQRALGLLHNLPTAYSYAKRAVGLHRDAFTLNTLGTVLMRRATQTDAALGPAQRKSYWTEGLETLVQAREEGRGRFEHPFVTFFIYTSRVLAMESSMDREWLTQAEQSFLDWRSEATRLGLFEPQALRRLLSGFPSDWVT